MGSAVGMGGATGVRGQIKWDYGIGIGGIWGLWTPSRSVEAESDFLWPNQNVLWGSMGGA